MRTSRVWIVYQPRLYTDLFRRLLDCIESIDVVDESNVYLSPTSQERDSNDSKVDVIILSVDHAGQPELALLPNSLPEAKLVAFSPTGEYGMRRLPGEKQWEIIRPFGLAQLINEVLGGQDKRLDQLDITKLQKQR